MKKLVLSIYMVLGSAFIFQGCSQVEFSGMRPITIDGNPVDNPCHCEVSCFEETYTQRKNPAANKLDIIFVTDTSGSLDVERNAVANGIGNFVGQLDPNIDFNIGVILAHGSTSSRTGKLYQSAKGESLVLKKSLLSLTQIRDGLIKKLTSPIPGDNASDGGEEGLYSTSQALTPTNKQAIIDAGLFRSDAALAVVYIADENDICARYPQGITPVVDPDGAEGPAFIRDCENVTAAGVYAQLKALKGDLPLAIGGVIYNNVATAPTDSENEVGYGYTDIIALNNGVSVDMAGNDISGQLAAIGTQVQGNINYQTEFPLHQTGIDVSTIKVFVNGTEVPHSYTADTNSVHIELNYCIPESEIKITYCLEPNDDNTSF